jgi:hypothetical protein
VGFFFSLSEKWGTLELPSGGLKMMSEEDYSVTSKIGKVVFVLELGNL